MTSKQTHLFKRHSTLPFVEMRQADKSRECYHTHSHDDFSFGIVDTGEAKYTNSDKSNRIGLGTTVTINPGDAHSCNPYQDNWSFRMLFVEAYWISTLQDEMGICGMNDYQHFPTLFTNKMTSYSKFNKLFENLAYDGDLESESLLIEYLTTMFMNTDETRINRKEKK